MITKISIELELPDKVQPRFLGSVLHGVIMERLPKDIVELLHHDYAYSPLKQRIYFNEHKPTWEIVSMSKELTQHLFSFLGTDSTLFLRHYNANVELKGMKIEKYDVKEIMNTFLGDNELSRTLKINIVTPMSFKSNGHYMIFPDIKMFFRSIMIQFDVFFSEHKMYDKETLEFLNDNVHIVNYRMRSSSFSLEKVKIPAFLGEITMKVKGPLPFLQLVHFLVAFGELSGSGIKTSLGMGKYNIVHRKTIA